MVNNNLFYDPSKLSSLPDLEKIDTSIPDDVGVNPSSQHKNADDLPASEKKDINEFSQVLKEFQEPDNDIPMKIIKKSLPKSDGQIDYYSNPSKLALEHKFKLKPLKCYVVVESDIPSNMNFQPEDLIKTLRHYKITDIRSIEFGLHNATGRFNGFAYMDVGSIQLRNKILDLIRVNSISDSKVVYDFTLHFRDPRELDRESLGSNQIPGHNRYFIQNLPTNMECKDIASMFLRIKVQTNPFTLRFISIYYNQGVFKGNVHVNISNELHFFLNNLNMNKMEITYGNKAYQMTKNPNVKFEYYTSP